MKKAQNKVWFITGTSTGFGNLLVKLALRKGDSVIATTRNIKALKKDITTTSDYFLPLQVNLASANSVATAVKKGIEKFGKIDVVVNNAGYVLGGSIEEISDKEFRQVMDINFFAALNVIRSVLPFMRKHKSGHIINISSNAGYVGMANAGSYNASKFALRGMSDALREELKPFGIKVSVIAPGEFRTNLWETDAIKFPGKTIQVYKTKNLKKNLSARSGTQMGDPQKLVETIFDIACGKNAPGHLIMGEDAYDLILDNLAKEKKEFEKWKKLSFSAGFKN